MTTVAQRYQRIAPFYDVLDLPFEYRRYRRIRPLLFEGLSGRILDAGVGTGRNAPFYPPDSLVTGIDVSAAMLARAERRCALSRAEVELRQMDVTALGFPDACFDAAVASFLFCVLPDDLQVPALQELGRVVRPGGTIRLLEYVRPHSILRRLTVALWQPWAAWAFGADLRRDMSARVPEAGLALHRADYVLHDVMQMLTIRVPG